MTAEASPATPDAARTVLAFNSGSSSLKFGLYRVTGSGVRTLLAADTGMEDASRPDHAVLDAIRRLKASGQPAPDLIGHRIVHGGPRLLAHCRIDDAVMQALEDAIPFAPLHGPAALRIIRLVARQFPGTPQAACFDTAFHADMPEVARTLPLPRTLTTEGLHRYGFHGLSCESIVRQLGPDLPRRLVVAHLGAGCSVTAVRAGRSIDTSMGLTPTGGVMMSTRSGDLDPGVLLYLMRTENLDDAGLEALVDRRSGLLGVSGISGDLRRLRAAAGTDAAARLALAMFCSSVRKQVAVMMSVLGGADLIVFTGGIGENDPVTREEICNGLAWAGVNPEIQGLRPRMAVDDGAGTHRCNVRTLPSQEDEQIALHTVAVSHTVQASRSASGDREG